MKNQIIALVAFTMLSIVSCKSNDEKKPIVAPETGKFDFRIETFANGDTFKLNKTFLTDYNDTLVCQTLQFFVTQIKLRKKGSSQFVVLDNYYYLFKQSVLEGLESGRVDHAGNSHISDVPVGEYDQIVFNVGIPIEKNHDPNTPTASVAGNSGMYWDMWKEHIFLRFEGKYGYNKDKAFLYHVTGDETLETVLIDLKNAPLTVSTSSKQKVKLKLQVDKFFSALDKIDVKTNHNHMSGDIVAKLANNCAKSFTLISVE